jgi:hypothetical protein
MNGNHDSRTQHGNAELERNGYNLAFCELGLGWHWDSRTYAELQGTAQERLVQTYLEMSQPHLLRAYDANFLAEAVESLRDRFVKGLVS